MSSCDKLFYVQNQTNKTRFKNRPKLTQKQTRSDQTRPDWLSKSIFCITAVHTSISQSFSLTVIVILTKGGFDFLNIMIFFDSWFYVRQQWLIIILNHISFDSTLNWQIVDVFGFNGVDYVYVNMGNPCQLAYLTFPLEMALKRCIISVTNIWKHI